MRHFSETFSTFPLKPLNRFQRIKIGSRISVSSTKFVFSGRSEKTRGLPWLLICWNLFNFSSATAENITWQEARSQRPLSCLCFAGRSEQWIGRPGIWLAKTFVKNALKLLNRIEGNLARSKISTALSCLWFSGWSDKQDGRPGLWLAETFSISPLKPLNGIQRNLTGSKISTSST